jgi:hypothetical protein
MDQPGYKTCVYSALEVLRDCSYEATGVMIPLKPRSWRRLPLARAFPLDDALDLDYYGPSANSRDAGRTIDLTDVHRHLASIACK